MFTSRFLLDVRLRAIRRGIWYRVLEPIERNILVLTARVVDRVESAVLGVELVKIISKLRDALKSDFVRRMEEYGLIQARKTASQAVAWGHDGAKAWATDPGLVRYLTLIDMNKPTGFGV